ncbi:MAG: hypothetical protein JWM32_1871 [Verrucomicrobia bacterium]|nr:hypothetical protein [Verrucomicrobiota bacterium]
MPFLDRLERIFGRFSIPHLALYIVIGQVFVLLSALMRLLDLSYFIMVPDLVIGGQWWRLVTMIFMPPAPGMFGYAFVAFAWYIFFLMGNSLEGYWGEFRFNLFVLTGYLLTVAVAFLTPQAATTNLFIAGSVFLAFAWLNPDFELSIFFILPVKIKWLALLMWLTNAYYFTVGSWPLRFQILASVGNFLIFFSKDIVQTMRYRKKVMSTQARRFATENAAPEARHRCRICGKTDLTNPEMDFRYCSKCAGDECYCQDHIFNHEHVTEAGDAAKK